MAFTGLMALFDELARQRREAMVGEIRVRFEEDYTGTILLLLLMAALSGGGSNVIG